MDRWRTEDGARVEEWTVETMGLVNGGKGAYLTANGVE